jgi:hypothetical protein
MTEQKIEAFWRDATAEDVARVMKGEKVEARFRDDDAEHWVESPLQGWRCDISFKWLGFDAYFRNCQVYEPQQWYIDKPDPGEGYRLLKKFPDEPKLATDEAWDVLIREWRVTSIDDGIQCEEVWYRRRIEPNSPEKLDSLACRGFAKGWTDLSVDEPRLASDAYWSLGANDWVIIGDARVEYANREKWPAIRQVENWRCMQLMEGCFYRLPNGQGINVTKEGFELL